VEDDIPAVALLHARVFGSGNEPASQALRGYLTQIFCHHPWYDKTFPSLVYEVTGGKIAGVLGIMRRPMTLNGQLVRVAIGHDFMVDPRSRPTLAALELLRVFLAGPQDLSLADGNTSSRKIWEAFGGTTSLPYSIRWTRPLRPGRCVMHFLRKRGLPEAVAVISIPWCSVLDSVAARIPGTLFHQSAPRVSGEELTDETLLACLSEFSRDRSLRPEYDKNSVKWLREILGQQRPRGDLRKILVRGVRGDVLGWYLYYLRSGSVGEVIQIGATHDSIGEVLDHLFFDAWRGGAIAVSGQLDPAFRESFSARHCLFDNGGLWMLLHSKYPEMLEAIHRGDAFLTRLEGEGWMRLAY
jgi:hypothetical protein